MADKNARAGKLRCPICRKPAAEAHTPFCSQRCADIDLGRWLGGDYRIPTDERPDAAPPYPEDED